MAKKAKRREWTKDDVRELKMLARQKTPVENREIAEANSRSNAAEGVLAWRVIGHARIGRCKACEPRP